MARRYVPLDNLTQVGLQEDIPSTGRMWGELTNVRRGDEGWTKRPGLDRIDGSGLPAVGIGDPKLIMTFKHPSSRPLSEIIRPTGLGNYTQWTAVGAASTWEAVDDTTADDDTTYIYETTDTQKVSLQFGALASTFNGITGLKIHVRAKRDTTDDQSLNVYSRAVGVDTLLGQIDIGAGAGYADFVVDATRNIAEDRPWNTTDLASGTFEIVLEKQSGGTVNNTTLTSDTRSMTGFIGLVAGSTSVAIPASAVTFTSINSAIITYTAQLRATVYASGSLLYTNPQTGISVGGISWPQSSGSSYQSNKTVTAFWVGNAASSLTVTAGPSDDATPEYDWYSVSVRRVGTVASVVSSLLRVTQVWVEVEGDGAAARRNSLLLLTSKAFLRMSEDLTTYSDVSGAVTPPTASSGIAWDYTTFLDKIYVANGLDQIYSYPNGSDVFEEQSGAPTATAVASFASRLCLGDVLENGARLPSRFRWSAINNATNWTDASSGNLECDETPGKIVKMLPLIEPAQTFIGVLVVYKNHGIYHLTATGNPASPFSKKLMDTSAGCIARGSLVGMTDSNGRDSHVFLGQVGGTLDVLSWNGRQIERFGKDIVPLIRKLGDSLNLEKTVGEIDAFGNYILLFPTNDGAYLRKALVYNFLHKVWSVWDIGQTSTMGRWTPSSGVPITVIARPDSFAYKFVESLSTDDDVGQDALATQSTIVTGDLGLMAPELHRECTIERVWIFYRDDPAGSTALKVSISADGGNSYRINETDAFTTVGLGAGSAGTFLKRVDCRVTGRKIKLKIESPYGDGKAQIIQILCEIEEAGTEPG